MVYIGSVGIAKPTYNIQQAEIKQLVQEIFPHEPKLLRRLLSVFDNAKVHTRQLVAPKKWYKETHSFEETNQLYINKAISLSLQAMDQCLHNSTFLQSPIEYQDIDLIIFVSSTGIATPSIDAHLINKRSFRENIIRTPLWGLGCAGGAIGLSRAFDWLKAYPEKTALVICCELCSLTFQKKDVSISNLVGTAIFGDGVGATLLVGEKSTYKRNLQKNRLNIKNTSSFIQKNSLGIMGWNVTNNGLGVIFSKQIPKLIRTLWEKHVRQFLDENDVNVEELSMVVAHPGGRKVLEEMVKVFQDNGALFQFSYDVLKQHGNMSSATVIYVLEKWLMKGQAESMSDHKSLLCALGPGFCSELLLLEWEDK